VDVGFWELMMLAVLALLIFGPERLPEIARTVGRVVGQVRREATSTFDALKAEVELDELTSFTDDLQREREALRSRSRLDARSLHARSGRRAGATDDPGEPPRFDPHAT
jgi:sec-independent protein translocase protein TatB